MKKFLFCLLTLSIISLSTPLYAEEMMEEKSTMQKIDTFQPSPWTTQETYADKSIHKLGYGLLNISAGWTAIPYEIDKHRKSNIFTGIFKGAYRSVVYTAGGVLHAATFPFPFDLPLPEGGVHFE